MRGPRKLIWLLGFLGLRGFGYFISYDLRDLVWFMFFGFFAFFFTRKLNTEQQDEMYQANMREASQFVLIIPTCTLYVIAFGAAQWGFGLITIMAIAMVSWIVTLVMYAYKLWQLERGT